MTAIKLTTKPSYRGDDFAIVTLSEPCVHLVASIVSATARLKESTAAWLETFKDGDPKVQHEPFVQHVFGHWHVVQELTVKHAVAERHLISKASR